MNFRKILKLSLVTLIIFIVQSCITVETDMKINSDFSGSTNSKIAIIKGAVTEEQLKIEISKLGIEKYTLKKEKSSDEQTDRYTVDINWKTEEDLKKILKFIGSGGMDLSTAGGLAGQQGKDTNKKSETEPAKIFTKEKGEVIVDMGTSKIAKLTVKVDGKIIPEENQSGTVSESKKEITFYQGDQIHFKYKAGGGLFGNVLKIVFGLIILAILGLIGKSVLSKSKKKNENSEEADKTVTVEEVEVVEENNKDEGK